MTTYLELSVRFLKKQSLLLAYILGLTTGISLLPVAQISTQAADTSDNQSSPQNGLIRACTGAVIELSSPQLTNEELTALTNCSFETLPQLLTALDSPDWKVKVIAAHTLGLSGIRSRPAIPALSNLIQDENADVRFAAAQALGGIGTEAVVPALTEALQDPDENVRVSAAAAFQNIGSAANLAKAELIAALWDGNWFVKNRAAATISKLGLNTSDIPAIVNPLRENLQPYNGAIVSLMLSIYPPVFNKLEDLPLFFIEGLESDNPEVRETAAIALGQVVSTRIRDVRLYESVSALRQAAKDQDSKVRASALRALYQIRPSYFYYEEEDDDDGYAQLRENIDFDLLKGLDDPDSNVRQVALASFEYYDRSVYSSTRHLAVILAALEAIEDEDPAVRQTAFHVLNSNLNELDSLPSLFKPQLPNNVFQALTNSLYDKDTNVRQNAGNNLEDELLLPALTDILQQRNIDLGIRYDAFATIAAIYEERIEQSQDIIKLLEEALEDSDIGIRVNAASALERTGNMSAQNSVPIFIEGLKSENPLVKLHAIFALDKMCSRRSGDMPRCAETKSALLLLIDTLKMNIKPLQYAAALAIADIDSKEESGIDILEEILLEETDRVLRENTIHKLNEIGSLKALSAVTHVELEDKQARYARTCLYSPRIPIYWIYWKDRFKSTDLFLEALGNPDVRMSASHNFVSFVGSSVDELVSLSEIQFLVSELTSILSNYTREYEENPVMQNIFKLKGQDIRRSVIYSLGTIGTGLLRSDSIKYYYNLYNFPNSRDFDEYPQVQEEIIEVLTNIAADQEENLDIRWVAAAHLQAANVPVDDFFLKENLIDPAIVLAQSRWVTAMELMESQEAFPNRGYSFLIPDEARPVDPSAIRRQHGYLLNQYGYVLGVPGLDFDIYSKQYIYDNREGCGAGLGEVFNTLQRLFNRTSE